MNYGDTVKGECKFCGIQKFRFMEEKGTYILGVCLGCGWVQWAKKVD